MSHEIRTPLSGIYGMMQLLSNTRMNREQESYVHSINKAILNLQSIVNDILDLSKINAGMLQIEETVFSIQEELSTLFHLLSAKARENGLKMTLDMDRLIAPWYKGDPHRIRQVLNNLIGNALKFTEKGEIAIRCTVEKAAKTMHWLKIEIKDTGIGIDDQFLNMIFDKFTQEEKGHARKFGGTGLGMSISRQLVELMNGKIAVESKKFKGTSVTISIPLKLTTNKPEKSSVVKRSGKLVNNRILVAEDNEINARVITSMLEQEGAKTFLVKNGKELIDKIKDSHFEIVISDLQMPLMGGIEAAKWIRKNIKSNIRLVALTANALSKEKKRCFAAGFDEVLFKPFRKEDLLNACLLPENEDPLNTQEEIAALPERLYHLEELNEMIDHDKAQLKLLVSQFIKETPGKIKNLEKAFRDKNQKEIKQLAHYLLSSVQHMGITSTYETLRELDKQKFIRSPKRMEQAILFVTRTLSEVIAQLKKDMRNGIK
jgi:CheY-like chemotaxis protein